MNEVRVDVRYINGDRFTAQGVMLMGGAPGEIGLMKNDKTIIIPLYQAKWAEIVKVP